MRVVIYARLSTKGQGQDTENQLHQFRAFAERHGTIYKVFTDQESGARPTAPTSSSCYLRLTRRSLTW